MKLEKIQKDDYIKVKELYINAFPKEERLSFFFLKRKVKKGKGKILVIKENKEFIGFMYFIEYKDIVYLLFYAIVSSNRSQGYGSQGLQLFLKQYASKRIFISREILDETSNNYQERVRRRQFYIRNGFVDYPYRIQEVGVTYDVMCVGNCIWPKEYDELIHFWVGRLIKNITNMKMIEYKNDDKLTRNC